MRSVQPVVGAQRPSRLHVVPPYVSSAGDEAIEVAKVAGLELDDWEQLVLRDALGETEAGRWAAYRVGLEVPRQNGKGTILEAREMAGLFAFGERLIIHSAHEQATATEHFNRVLALMEGVPEFDQRILKVVRGKGTEAILLRDGYRIFFKTRTGGGGRGFTGNLVVFDEAMILAAAFMAALVPTMAARSISGDPQLWFAGSSVDQEKTEHGIEFARVRADAVAGNDDRLAYFGWGLPYEKPDEVPEEVAADPESWAATNPGLGIRIAEQYVADERRALGAREFAVERLGVGDWPRVDGLTDDQIDFERWQQLTDPQAGTDGPYVFAYDVTPSRHKSAVAVAGPNGDGGWFVEVAEHKSGTRWLPEWFATRVDEYEMGAALYDQRSPAAAVESRLRDEDVKLEPVGSGDVAAAAGMFFDAIMDGTVSHLGQDELDAAVRGAVKAPLGDAWKWSRRSSQVDISPLVAASLALWGAMTRKPRPSRPLIARR